MASGLQHRGMASRTDIHGVIPSVSPLRYAFDANEARSIEIDAGKGQLTMILHPAILPASRRIVHLPANYVLTLSPAGMYSPRLQNTFIIIRCATVSLDILRSAGDKKTYGRDQQPDRSAYT